VAIVLYGRSCDPVLQYFCHYLQQQESIVVFIDQDQLGTHITLDQVGWHWKQGPSLLHQDIVSVFNRSASLHPAISYPMAQQQYHMRAWSWLDYECPMVLNRPRFMMSNTSKPYQSLRVRSCGLSMPRYACLANVRMIATDEPLIAKSISAVRSVVGPYVHKAGDSVQEPVLFQARILGDNVRVHVIGAMVVAIRIRSSAVDYRYAEDVDYTCIKLPDAIRQSCIDISQELGLPFCGIDLIYYDSAYYFLEANPAPGYNAFERHIQGNPISQALYGLMQPGV